MNQSWKRLISLLLHRYLLLQYVNEIDGQKFLRAAFRALIGICREFLVFSECQIDVFFNKHLLQDCALICEVGEYERFFAAFQILTLSLHLHLDFF